MAASTLEHSPPPRTGSSQCGWGSRASGTASKSGSRTCTSYCGTQPWIATSSGQNQGITPPTLKRVTLLRHSLHASLVPLNLNSTVGALLGDELSQVLRHGVPAHVHVKPSSIHPLPQVTAAHRLVPLREERRSLCLGSEFTTYLCIAAGAARRPLALVAGVGLCPHSPEDLFAAARVATLCQPAADADILPEHSLLVLW